MSYNVSLMHVIIVCLALGMASLRGFAADFQSPALSSNTVVALGKPAEGVSVRLRADKANWATNGTPTFRLDVRNQGQREFYTFLSQEAGRLQVDGTWYEWTGAIDLKGSPLPPQREYRDIAVSLGGNWTAKQEWRDKTKPPPPLIPLRLPPGKHTIRFATEIRDITVKPKPRNLSVPSNPVEIEISSAFPPAISVQAAPSRPANAKLQITIGPAPP